MHVCATCRLPNVYRTNCATQQQLFPACVHASRYRASQTEQIRMPENRQVTYARSSADLAEGPSLNMTGNVSGPWHGRRWVQAVLHGLEQE